jgi:hypothetical protein
MIIIDDILVSDELITEEFVCHLEKCKGGCCVDGDAGAPLTKEETRKIKSVYKIIKHELTPQAQDEIRANGPYTNDDFFGYVTPAIDGGICAYGYYDEQGIVKCLIEKAYNEGRTDFKKPISCHLYPIREIETEHHTMLNYSPRKKLCAPACKLGKQLHVKVYEFLKEPIVRRFGEAFYNALDEIAKSIHKKK